MSQGHVLFLTEFGSGLGGVEQYLASLTRQLTDSGWTVTVICGTPGETTVFDPAVTVEVIPGLTNAFRRTPELDRSLDDLLSRARPDLIHFHLVNAPGYVRLLSQRYPTLVSVHNHYLTCPSGFRLLHSPERQCGLQPGPMCVVNAYVRRCNSRRPAVVVTGLARALANRRALGSVKRLVVHGPYMRQTLIDAGVAADKIRIVPSLPSPVFQPGGQMGPEPSLLYAGRLAEEKGVQVVLNAMPSVPRVRLVVAGEGYYRPQLERIATRLGLTDRVAFVGRIHGEELADLYGSSWAGVMPSLWPEPFGLGGLEAMASARAVVGFDSGDISSWLKDGVTGRLVPWNDRLAFVAALDEICSRDVASAFGRAARQEFEATFSRERHLGLILGVYQELL